MLALITGSGVYSLEHPEVTCLEEITIETKFGKTSGAIQRLKYRDNEFLHLPRHGVDHSWPPHRIPYRANMHALKELGVTHVIAHCVCGSLKKDIVPGSFVILDQFVDFTKRVDDFEPYNQFVHLPMAEPYCSHSRRVLREIFGNLGYITTPSGTIVVIEGPRFTTLAESRMFMSQEWDVVNMTQFPECYLAREYGINYAAFASVTDYNVGVTKSSEEITPEGFERVLKVFEDNSRKSKTVLFEIAENAQKFLSSPQLVSNVFKEFFRK